MTRRSEKTDREVSPLSVVGDDEMPRVENHGSILQLAKTLGQLAPRLPLFELNGELVYYNHRRERAVMTGRVFRGWIEREVFVVGGYDPRSGEPRSGSFTLSDCMDILVQPDFRQGVRQMTAEENVRLPVIRKDGTLELLPYGYDEETGIYTVPGGIEYDQATDVAMAKQWFSELFGDFPLSDDRSFAAQVASVVGLYVRHLPGGSALRPGFLWKANKPGSGKSVLAKLGLYAVFGHAAVAKMKRGEELDKELEAFMRAAVPYIFLDNVYGSLASASIDQLITSEESTGRAMGGHGVFRAKNTAQLMVTGNQLELNEDAQRRFAMVDLFDPEDPSERKVSLPLNDKVMRSEEFRRRTLAGLWALVKHWHDRGRPAGAVVLPTFEEYTALVGGIVATAGYSEPFERAEFADELNPEKADFLELSRLIVRDMRESVTGMSEEDEAESSGGIVKEYQLADFVKLARGAGLFTDVIGTEDDGRRQTIKAEGLKGDVAVVAQDEGHVTPSQRSKFSKILTKYRADKPTVDGQKIEFGKRREKKRGHVYTVEFL